MGWTVGINAAGGVASGASAWGWGLLGVVIGLLGSTGWILAHAQDRAGNNWPLWLLTVVVTLLVWRSRIHLLWLLAAGGALGALGWV